MLRIMSFNIRYGTAEDGENGWERRKSLVIERIKAYDPDLLGLQECRDDEQALHIKNNLPEYEFYGVQRGGDSATALEMAPLLFKRKSFSFTRSGHFWLSEMPHLPGSKSWGSIFPRTVTWLELVHLNSGKSLLYLNTHFDYQLSATVHSARFLRKWINHRSSSPLLLTGDFNADKNSSAYRELTTGTLQDVFKTPEFGPGMAGTFHGFGKVEPSAIDWILTSDHFEVMDARVDRFHEGGLYPSDHFPVMAELRFKQA